MSLTRTYPSGAGPFYTSGPISFSSLRTNFKQTSSGSVSASELRRDTDVTETNPVVPDCTENRTTVTVSPPQGISTQNNLKLSQFRNSIKYYDLTQGSDTDINLNIGAASLWNSNLQYNINKRVALSGTSGSTNSTAAARLNATTVYNVLLTITGTIQGSGGTGGTNGGNGGDGGNALYINTNNTGTVTVLTSGSAAKVYGGGGGGGSGGRGGKGGNGQWTTYSTYYTSVGGPGGTYGGSYDQRCRSSCSAAGAEWVNNCYKHTSEGGQNCGGDPNNYSNGVCYSDDASSYAQVTACRKSNTQATTNNSTGGDGGDPTDGGNGRGYTQARTNGQAFNSGESGGTNAGTGGNSGTGGNGGNWGQGGSSFNGGNGVKGSDGTQGPASVTEAPDFGETNGPVVGGQGGSAGAAVSGSGYTIDTNGVNSAYKGSK